MGRRARTTDRIYLTAPRVEALLALATIGANELEAERDQILNYGEFDLSDLEEHDRYAVAKIDAQLDAARYARAALSRRYRL